MSTTEHPESPESPNRLIVTITYTNHRGETAERRIVPQELRFGSSEWHPQAQWLLAAWDLEKSARRDFAVKDIHEWKPWEGS